MITGDITAIKAGHDILFPAVSADIKAKTSEACGFHISGKNGTYTIEYGSAGDYFRGMTILSEAVRNDAAIDLTQQRQVESLCAMFDCSRGAVKTVGEMKRMIGMLAKMGYNELMLYTEDTIRIEGDPYFGYMRGAYSADEIKELVAYAELFGIEMIPCVELLSHMCKTLHWGVHGGMKNSDRTLLVGEEKTYAFIDAYLKTLRECYRSDKIHIGFDEADDLADGVYRQRFGDRSVIDVFREHLTRVTEMARSYGFEPMIWADMIQNHFLRDMSDETIETGLPEGIGIVYWDYSNNDAERIEKNIRRTRRLSDNVMFAGGIWTMDGVCCDNEMTWYSGYNACTACKKNGIGRVIVTMWGDNGGECPVEAALPGLMMFAEHLWQKGNPDHDTVAASFRRCTGADLDTFLRLGLDDGYPRELCHYHNASVTKQALYQDVLLGLFDDNFSSFDLHAHFAGKLAALETAEVPSEYALLFDYHTKLCRALTIKCDIGIRLADAYRQNDRAALSALADELRVLYGYYDAFDEAAAALWYATNKPQGFEVIDLRIGGLMTRIRRAEKRVRAYLAGEAASLEELEEARLYYDAPGREKAYPLFSFWNFTNIFTANLV